MTEPLPRARRAAALGILLAARSHLKYAKLEARLAEALAGRFPGVEAAFDGRLVAVIVVGLLRHFAEQMQAAGAVSAADVEEATAGAFANLKRSLARLAADR